MTPRCPVTEWKGKGDFVQQMKNLAGEYVPLGDDMEPRISRPIASLSP